VSWAQIQTGCSAANNFRGVPPCPPSPTVLKKIIVDQLGADPGTVVDDANFVDDLGADSLEVVQVVMEIEEEFGVEIPDSAASTILTVGDAIRFIEKNKA